MSYRDHSTVNLCYVQLVIQIFCQSTQMVANRAGSDEKMLTSNPSRGCTASSLLRQKLGETKEYHSDEFHAFSLFMQS